MNDSQVRSKLKAKVHGKFNVGQGLYFRVSNEGIGFWMLRYTINGKRREYSFGRDGRPPQGMTLAAAKDKAGFLKAKLRDNIDPIVEKKRRATGSFNTVDDVALDWLRECEKRLKHPDIPKRVYREDISPILGDIAIDQVNVQDVLRVIRATNASNRPAIAEI